MRISGIQWVYNDIAEIPTHAAVEEEEEKKKKKK